MSIANGDAKTDFVEKLVNAISKAVWGFDRQLESQPSVYRDKGYVQWFDRLNRTGRKPAKGVVPYFGKDLAERPLRRTAEQIDTEREDEGLEVVGNSLSTPRDMVDTANSYGWSPFHYACARGNLDLVVLFVREFAADDETKTHRLVLSPTKNASRDTPLHCAVRGKSYAVAKFLLEKCPHAVHEPNAFGQLAIHWACGYIENSNKDMLSLHYKIIKLLVQADPDSIHALDHAGYTAMDLLLDAIPEGEDDGSGWFMFHEAAHVNANTLTLEESPCTDSFARINNGRDEADVLDVLDSKTKERDVEACIDPRPSKLTPMARLANTRREQGKLAEGMQRDCLSLTRRMLGERHPDTTASNGKLASTTKKNERGIEACFDRFAIVTRREQTLSSKWMSSCPAVNSWRWALVVSFVMWTLYCWFQSTNACTASTARTSM